MDRSLRVTGKGLLKLSPDTTRITLTLEDTLKEYGDALRKSSADTLELKDTLAGLDIPRNALKTLRFDVEPTYESYRSGEAYRQRLVGYKFTHVLKVDFPSDPERLGKILYALAHCKARPTFRVSYTLSNPEAAKNALLAKAITDAREKASVLAAAASVALKEIRSIDYSWSEIDIEAFPMAAQSLAPMRSEESYLPDIEPDDIELTDNVTVIWTIQ